MLVQSLGELLFQFSNIVDVFFLVGDFKGYVFTML